MKVWLVLKATPEQEWCLEVQGVFESEELAIAACRNERYALAPFTLNENLPDEPVHLPWIFPKGCNDHAWDEGADEPVSCIKCGVLRTRPFAEPTLDGTPGNAAGTTSVSADL